MRRVLFLFVLLMFAPSAQAQNKLDLDELQIKGELMNDNQLRVNARASASIDDRVKYRRSYRNEILETYDGVAKPAPAKEPIKP